MAPYPAITQFYERFAAEPKTAEALETGAAFPEPFKQCFVAGAEVAE